jgi:hypothetical protein
VTSDRELIAAADENFVASFRTLAEHVSAGDRRERPGIFAFVTGLPMSLFNGCVVTHPVGAAELDSALDWVRERSASFRFWVSDGLGAEQAHLSTLLAREPSPFPGMTLHPIPEPPSPAPGVTVEPVDADGADEFVAILVQAGFPPAMSRELLSPGFVADPSVSLFIGRLDGEPVGTSLALRSPSASGVYNVVTLERARRRGVGTALTWAAAAAGRAWGRDTIVLQSSAMAESMYRAMGFRLVAPYAVFSSTD